MLFNVEIEKAKSREHAPINGETYKTDYAIRNRTRKIFHRFAFTLKGRGFLPIGETEAEMENLARVVRNEVIHPLLSSPAAIAGSQAQFDEWHRKAVGSLKTRCPITWRYGSSLTDGMAQWIINLHCKDLWALDLVPESHSRFFHSPISGITLKYLLKRKVFWTKLDSYENYMELQLKVRQMARCRNTYAMALECWNYNENRQRR